MPACCGATEILLETQAATRWSAHCGNVLDEVDYARAMFADRVPIIVGNPPYANFGRRNRGNWILRQLDAYKAGLHEKKHNLADDFIKFLRWGQYWIDQSDCGILAMVTNNTYLHGLTHRQMRASLAVTFNHIDLLDLHGNRKQRELTPAGDVDENVFGIQQGVAIGVFVKCRPAGRRRRIAGSGMPTCGGHGRRNSVPDRQGKCRAVARAAAAATCAVLLLRAAQ